MRPNDNPLGHNGPDDEGMHQESGLWRMEPDERFQSQWNPLAASSLTHAPLPRAPRERTVRDVLAIGFRQKRKILATFSIGVALGLYWISGLPRDFESEMKILVRRGRVDQVVTAQLEQARGIAGGVDLQEINTEAHILSSRELAAQVIGASPSVRQAMAGKPDSGLASMMKSWVSPASPTEPGHDDAVLAGRFLDRLKIVPLGQSNVIQVRFAAESPEVATESLELLSQAYLDKHLEVHRSSGADEVFSREADRHEAELTSLKSRLADLTGQSNVVNVELEKDILVQKTLDLESELQQTKASIAGFEKRIDNLERESQSTPQRRTTAVRTSPMLLESLREDLNRLELQRIELESKFLPDYGPVVQVKEQIAATEAAIREAQSAPPVEEITDRDPTFDWVSAELARTRADLAAARAVRFQLSEAVSSLRGRSVELGVLDRTRVLLERDATAAEQSLMAYRLRADEARISAELDRERILNVAIAEAPSRPVRPVGLSKKLLALALLLLSAFAALGIGLLADLLDPTYRRADELEDMLRLPVLASLPKV